ncbi:hypothetical protein M569_04431 [Genlisea aurea]|uniref:Methyltransferase n=1 Tax=Genlisea aurea TaxID=192259 RepID=S8ECQ9_9LAMI|nr:hypothetical protein M569_04431 [Genlisea aurea]
MAIARLGQQVRRSYQPHGFCLKLSAVVILGMCFVLVWSIFSSFSVTSQRETFDDIGEAVSAANGKGSDNKLNRKKVEPGLDGKEKKGIELKNDDGNSERLKNGDEKRPQEGLISKGKDGVVGENVNDGGNDQDDADVDGDGDPNGAAVEAENIIDNDDFAGGDNNSKFVVGNEKKQKKSEVSPLFDPKAKYNWKLCNTRSKHNYIPCIDIENGGIMKIQSYRHHERSCPRSDVMCLVPLPHDGYGTPVRWPESKTKILYKNVAHPKLAAFVKTQDWLVDSGEYLTFPLNQSAVSGGIEHYLESIEEMVPDIEWGKNIRLFLDMECKDSSLGSVLLEKDVLTLCFGLKDDMADLAQVALERGFPAIVGPFASRRLPFPSGTIDAIHCGDCSIPWSSSGGKLLLEMNRILRPEGYFILSTKHNTVEGEEALSKLAASICWNILADRADDVSDTGIKIYQKPDTNGIYGLRRKKSPPLCKEDENPDAAWYIPLATCLHPIPEAVEQRGTEWPAEWPARLQTFPEWMTGKEKMAAESQHWKAIVNNSYLTGTGIDWSAVRNVLDMRAIHGGFAAALSDEKVWVMNVVPVHGPDTLPVILERGLMGIYHDWCEAFSSYPRSYDLLHADHLFSRLNGRCREGGAAVVVVVEMDRLVRPGGWAVVRDRVEVVNGLEEILRSLHWEIRMTFVQGKEALLCAQKTLWRPR